MRKKMNFNIEMLHKCFKSFLDIGYKVIFEKEEFFLMNTNLGFVIKIFVNEASEICAGVKQCELGELKENEDFNTLNEFSFDTDYSIKIESAEKTEDALINIGKEILVKDSYWITGKELKEHFTREFAEFLQEYEFQIHEIRFGGMSRTIRLWNEQFGLSISRNYYSNLINCMTFRHQSLDNEQLITESLPLDKLLTEHPDLASSRDLSNTGQDMFFSDLVNYLTVQRLAFIRKLNDESVEWNKMSFKADGSYPLIANDVTVVY